MIQDSKYNLFILSIYLQNILYDFDLCNYFVLSMLPINKSALLILTDGGFSCQKVLLKIIIGEQFLYKK